MKSSSSGRLPRTASYLPEISESHTVGPEKKERGKKEGRGEKVEKKPMEQAVLENGIPPS